jgi:hypothetical protein
MLLMLHGTVLALVFALALMQSVEARGSRVRIHILGMGAERCDIISSERINREDVIRWVEGFWSGLNYVAAASDQKQSVVDPDVMMAEIEKVCRQKSSQILASAAWTAFLRLNGR